VGELSMPLILYRVGGWNVVVIPVPNVSTNDETVGDDKLEKDKGSNNCNVICFSVGLARFVT